MGILLHEKWPLVIEVGGSRILKTLNKLLVYIYYMFFKSNHYNVCVRYCVY